MQSDDDKLAPARGVIYGILFSIPFWVVIYALTALV